MNTEPYSPLICVKSRSYDCLFITPYARDACTPHPSSPSRPVPRRAVAICPAQSAADQPVVALRRAERVYSGSLSSRARSKKSVKDATYVPNITRPGCNHELRTVLLAGAMSLSLALRSNKSNIAKLKCVAWQQSMWAGTRGLVTRLTVTCGMLRPC